MCFKEPPHEPKKDGLNEGMKKYSNICNYFKRKCCFAKSCNVSWYFAQIW